MPINHDDLLAEALDEIPVASGIPPNALMEMENGDVNVGKALGKMRSAEGRKVEPNDNLKTALRRHGLELEFTGGVWRLPAKGEKKKNSDEEHVRRIKEGDTNAFSTWHRKGRVDKPSDSLIEAVEGRGYQFYQVDGEKRNKYYLTYKDGSVPESATRLTASRLPASSLLPEGMGSGGAVNAESSKTKAYSPPAPQASTSRKR